MAILDYGLGRPTSPKADLSYAVEELRHAIERSEREIKEWTEQRSDIDARILKAQARIDDYRAAIVQFEHAVEVLTRKAID
jgi:chromosome segregation ATPase